MAVLVFLSQFITIKMLENESPLMHVFLKLMKILSQMNVDFPPTVSHCSHIVRISCYNSIYNVRYVPQFLQLKMSQSP